MQPVTDAAALFDNPIGRYLGCGSCFYFWADTTLSGTVAWGSPSADDVRKLCSLYEVELTSVAPPHVSYVDLSRVEGIAAPAFAVMADYFKKNAKKLRGHVTKQALIRPKGIAGAVVAGFYDLVVAEYPVRVFEDRSEALAYLDYSPAVLRELEAIYEAAAGTGEITRRVREHVAADLRAATIRTAAKALAMSERTLQRRLKDEGTSFQSELHAAQVREAKRLLAETDTKLTAVALDVGCATQQHFSDLFKKLTGETPSAFRKANGK